MGRHRTWRVAFVIGGLLIAGNGWAGEPASPDAGLSPAADSGVVRLDSDPSAPGTISDFGSIRRYQYTGPSGEMPSGTVYRFGHSQGMGSAPVTPMIAGPPMRVAPFIPMVPMLPVLPNGGMAPVVPNIGVITPGPAPGTSTWGKGR